MSGANGDNLDCLVVPPSLREAIERVKNRTDGWPWYWLSYGEKCYAFAVVEAFPVDEGDDAPHGGTRLTPHEDDAHLWVGENGTLMLMGENMASIEEQYGDAVCAFIAQAHTALCGDNAGSHRQEEAGQ